MAGHSANKIKTPVPCCKRPSSLNFLKKFLKKESGNSTNATQFIVELNNTMAVHYVGDKATSKISLANMTFISDVNATISGIKELCLKSGIPSVYCKLKEITGTQSETFGNISEISGIANGSNAKLTGLTEIVVPKNISDMEPSPSDLSVKNHKLSNNKGIH